MKARYLVVGSGGFLARHVLAHLATLPDTVFITAGRGTGPGAGEARHHRTNCGELEAITEIILGEKPDRILNLAGSSGPDFGEMLHYNVRLPEAILAAASRLGGVAPARVVLVGSAAEFGNPTALPVREATPTAPCNAYGLTKSMQFQLALYFRRTRPEGPRISVAHLFNLIGPGSPERLVFGSLVRQIATARDWDTILTGNLTSERDFVHAADAAAALVAIADLPEPATSYVVASGRSLPVNRLLDHLVAFSGRRVRTAVDPARLNRSDVPAIHGTSELLERETGWRPSRSAESAIEEMWKEVTE